MGVDIDKLEALAKAATPGPWEMKTLPTNRDFHYAASNNISSGMVCYGSAKDTAYIVAACNAVPELIAENRVLKGQVQRLEMRVADYIEERDTLVCTKYALEQQREWLAKKCEELSDDVEDSFMPYHIPAKKWIKRAEQATKGPESE